jgi:hypothetical protein
MTTFDRKIGHAKKVKIADRPGATGLALPPRRRRL